MCVTVSFTADTPLQLTPSLWKLFEIQLYEILYTKIRIWHQKFSLTISFHVASSRRVNFMAM